VTRQTARSFEPRCITHSTLLVKYLRLQPVQRSTIDTEGDLKLYQQDVVVDGIKYCGQIKSNQIY